MSDKPSGSLRETDAVTTDDDGQIVDVQMELLRKNGRPLRDDTAE